MDRATAQTNDRCGILISDFGAGPLIHSDLVSCAHCDYSWVWQPGSGRMRGRCMRCGGLVCGRPCCQPLGCSHREQRLDNLEQGRALDFRPILVSGNWRG